MVRLIQNIIILLIVLAIFSGGILFFHENILEWWARRNIADKLSAALNAEVRIAGFSWRDGVINAKHLEISNPKYLPFISLNAGNIQLTATWQTLFRQGNTPLNIEIEDASVVLREDLPQQDHEAPHPHASVQVIPKLDLVITNFSAKHPAPNAWEIKSSEVRILHEDALWSFAASGGTLELPQLPALQIERISIERKNDDTNIKGFALNDASHGVIAGSAFKSSSAPWMGEISWQDVVLSPFTSQTIGKHFAGKGNGDAHFKNDTLSGRIKIQGMETREVPGLVQLAGIMTGEDWSVIPWETFSFSFERDAHGKTTFRDLVALSSKGVAVRGEGAYTSDALRADLHLGVRSKKRPWLVAFVPTLFRNENDGYFWTPVRIGGTPAAPTEDLSSRVALAITTAPAHNAIKAATQAPEAAVEAAGSLLRGLLR